MAKATLRIRECINLDIIVEDLSKREKVTKIYIGSDWAEIVYDGDLNTLLQWANEFQLQFIVVELDTTTTSESGDTVNILDRLNNEEELVPSYLMPIRTAEDYKEKLRLIVAVGSIITKCLLNRDIPDNVKNLYDALQLLVNDHETKLEQLRIDNAPPTFKVRYVSDGEELDNKAWEELSDFGEYEKLEDNTIKFFDRDWININEVAIWAKKYNVTLTLVVD